MRNKRSKFLLAIFILLLVFNARINRMINASIEDQAHPQMSAKETNPDLRRDGFQTRLYIDIPPEPSRKNPLTPDDPAKFGILVQKEENRPRNQSQWDQQMKRSLVQSKALDNMEEKDAFDGIKLTPQEFQKRVQMISSRIKDYEKITQDNPSDDAAQEKLQTLYMLKSTLTVMERKIVDKAGKK